MIIAIHDAERDHMPGKKFPNYALMKISAHHKAKGDRVEWWNGLMNETYDMVYSSKVFDFTPGNPYLPEDAIKGGTGYTGIPIDSRLTLDIDTTRPDYSIYPDCDHSVGYLTRGCPNHCPWCIVPEKEGDIAPYRNWVDIARLDTNKMVLMDNNILSCDFGIRQLESLVGSGQYIDLNQGMDARLVTPDIAKLLSRIDWIRHIRFSCDTAAQIESIMQTAANLEKFGVKPYRMFIYVLVTKDIEDAAHRVEALKRLQGVSIYAQPERNGRLGIIPNKYQREFAERYVYGRCYLSESWTEYVDRIGYVRGLHAGGEKQEC